MITPSYGLTATERVLPKLALDFTTATLDSRITFTRALDTATRVNSSGNIESVLANVARFDFDPVTLACKGLLIEESRINIALYSNDFRDTAAAGATRPWVWTRATVSSNVVGVTSPDGTENASKLIEDTTATSTHVLSQNISVTTGVAYTFTQFFKAGERGFARLLTGGTPFGTNGVTVNLTTGAIAGTVGTLDSTAVVTAYKNGWFRVSITKTSTATGTGVFTARIALSASVDSYTGDGTSGIYVYGGQLEAGAFSTSYIPTVATSVTRNADVATMTGTNFSDWFNASEGTFEVTASNFASDSTQRRAITANDTTNQNIIDISRIGSTAQSRSTILTANVAVFNSLNAAWSLSTTASVVTSYKQNDFAACLGGGTIRTDNTGDVPAVTQLQIGNLLSIQFWCGHIQKVMYWQQRLTNNEVQAFSK